MLAAPVRSPTLLLTRYTVCPKDIQYTVSYLVAVSKVSKVLLDKFAIRTHMS